MKLLYTAFALTIAGNVLYHLSQKSISGGAHPIVSIIASYVTAIALSLLVLPFVPLRGSFNAELARLNWASVGVGAAIVAVELGFLLAYRAGGRVSLAAVTSNTAVGLLLIPAGVLLFHERLTPTHLAGVVFCVIGLALVTR